MGAQLGAYLGGAENYAPKKSAKYAQNPVDWGHNLGAHC